MTYARRQAPPAEAGAAAGWRSISGQSESRQTVRAAPSGGVRPESLLRNENRCFAVRQHEGDAVLWIGWVNGT